MLVFHPIQQNFMLTIKESIASIAEATTQNNKDQETNGLSNADHQTPRSGITDSESVTGSRLHSERVYMVCVWCLPLTEIAQILNCSNSNNSIPHSTQSSSHSFHWSHQPDIPRRQWLSSYISNLSTRRRSSILLRKVHGINIIKAVSDFFSGSHFSWLCLDPTFPPSGQSLPIFLSLWNGEQSCCPSWREPLATYVTVTTCWPSLWGHLWGLSHHCQQT